MLWSIAAVVGGPVFRVAGRWWVDPRPWRRAIAIGLMPSVAIAEGWYLRGVLPEATVGTGFMAVGLALPLLLGRSWRDRATGSDGRFLTGSVLFQCDARVDTLPDDHHRGGARDHDP